MPDFDPKLGVRCADGELRFIYDRDVFGPQPEFRRLQQIRPSLRDANCVGPDPVYAIAMDVGRLEHRDELRRRMLLFGVVAYAAGQLGDEPVRSQGHVHATVPGSGWAPPELFEIWEGRAIIYAQERVADDPGRCVAITAEQGDKVVVPPGWAHFVANADPAKRMVFGAWCHRQYGFVYDAIRARGGLAWFPIVDADHGLRWEANPAYADSKICLRGPRPYRELGVPAELPIYQQFATNPDSIGWISDPGSTAELWDSFEL